jgi:hypothetical protein
MIHWYKETKDCNQEGIEKKQQNRKGLPDPVREKVGKCSSTKEIWDKIHNLYSKESLITESDPIKETVGTEQEEICFSY